MRYLWHVFDLDGTISQSDSGIIDCARRAIIELGYDLPSDADMYKFIGPPLKWSFMELAGMDEPRAMQAIDIYRARYFDVGWIDTRIYPGVADLLLGIKRAGGHVALASSKPAVLCERILAHFGLRKYFDNVTAIGLNDHGSDKSWLISKALEDCEDKSRAVMIGDRIYDAEGARKAGVDFIGVKYGYGALTEFENAAFVAETPLELLKYLEIPRARGKFITFEGADGCGKTTQFKMAADYLARRGWDIITSREPGGCPISEKIRDIVLDPANPEMGEVCEALLYAAARAQHTREVILPALDAGKTVLCDRYIDSSIAYQGAGRELTRDLVRQINAPAVAGLNPDITLYYRADAETARARISQAPDRLESESDEFKRRVDAGFEALADENPDRIIRVDSRYDIKTVFEYTRRAVDGIMDRD